MDVSEFADVGGGGHIFGKFTMQKFLKLNFPEGGPYPAAPPPLPTHIRACGKYCRYCNFHDQPGFVYYS